VQTKPILTFLATLLMVKILIVILIGYRDYLPATFESGFLAGREAYFYGVYRWVFTLHIVSGPCSLILARVLISQAFRLRYTKVHRCMGRIQTALVLMAVAPSGLWMAFYSDYGPWAAAGFAGLALATGTTVFLGWRAAVQRRFADHRRWMMRCFWLLASAIILRLLGGAASLLDWDSAWTYPASAWLSWLGPLIVYEMTTKVRTSQKRHPEILVEMIE
jgi:hypothetical protein